MARNFCFLISFISLLVSRDSAVGIATGYGVGVPVPEEPRIFSFSALSRLYLATYPMRTVGYFSGIKAAGE
jgi:hypothetical protein